MAKETESKKEQLERLLKEKEDGLKKSDPRPIWYVRKCTCTIEMLMIVGCGCKAFVNEMVRKEKGLCD